MDNRLNEIRRKISFLRSEMLATEDIIRKQINRDKDCTEASLRLMAMRTTMLSLIGERDSLGGSERLLDVEERLKAEYRAVNRKPLKGALGHTLGASGAAELALLLECLSRGRVPATRGFETPDGETGVAPAGGDAQEVRRVLFNLSGFGGNVLSLALERSA